VKQDAAFPSAARANTFISFANEHGAGRNMSPTVLRQRRMHECGSFTRLALHHCCVHFVRAGVSQVFHVPPSALSTWGAWAIFVNVLATRLGVPIPAAPALVLAGAAVTTGLMSFWHVLGAAVVAALIADSIRFTIGRQYGRRVLNALVRISLSVDTCVRKARAWFELLGAPILSLSYFIPGLGLITPPLLGTTRTDTRAFLAWDCAGALAWATFWLLGGAAFASAFSRVTSAVSAYEGIAIKILIVTSAIYLVYRCIQRSRFRRWLAHVLTTPEQLDTMMRSTHPPVILDARPKAVRKAEPHKIPGATMVDLNSPERLDATLLEHDIVVYCVCPNEATARQIAHQMRRKGFAHAHALKGGLDAWERQGYPVEPIPLDSRP
jgi:membrane protein DedA with SNARE-associated domain/rhodanese-related sulfurtransferase